MEQKQIPIHIQVPDMDLKKDGLIITDPLVYACLKSHENKKTVTAFPSIALLMEETNLGRDAVMSALKRLSKANYITVQYSKGAPTTYTFNPYKSFEIFSPEFLKSFDASPGAKGYLIATQSMHLKNQDTQSGSIIIDNERICYALNISMNTLKKYEKELEEKGVLSKVEKVRSPVTGLMVSRRDYYYPAFKNDIVFMKAKIVEHDSDINQLKIELAQLRDQIKSLASLTESKQKERVVEDITL